MSDETTVYTPAFYLFGVPWTTNEESVQFVFPKLFIGIIVALIFRPKNNLTNNILAGLGYGVILNLALVCHIIGHILFSKMVVPPMSEARITPTLIETRYDNDPDEVVPRVHIIRSLGGPSMNMTLGVAGFVLWLATKTHWLLYVAGVNWTLMFFLLMPFPTVDGEVIWREVGKLLREKRNGSSTC